MKKLFIVLLLFISLKSNSQLIIAPSGNAAPAGNYPAVFDIHLKGSYRAVKDTFERNAIPLSFRKNMMLVGDTTSKKIWLFDSLRNSWSEFGASSSFDPSANQTITAELWDFKNYIHVGENHHSGIWNNDLLTVVGDWSNDGTNITVDADNGAVQSWGNFQVWGFVGENDYATPNAQINSDGSASFASNISNPNVTIYQNGQIDVAEAIDLYPDGRAVFAAGKSQLAADGGGHFANWNIYWDANGNISNDNNGAWAINADGSAGFRSISGSYTDEYNYYRSINLSGDNVSGVFNNNDGNRWQWSLNVDGLSYVNDDGDSYIYSSWGINQVGAATLASASFGGTMSNPDITNVGDFGANGYSSYYERNSWQINNLDGSAYFANNLIGWNEFGEMTFTPTTSSIYYPSLNLRGDFIYGIADDEAGTTSFQINTADGSANFGNNALNVADGGISNSSGNGTWTITGDGNVYFQTVSFDNGLIASDGNGNLSVQSIKLWDDAYGDYSPISVNDGCINYNTLNYGNKSLLFNGYGGDYSYIFPDKNLTVAGLDDVIAVKPYRVYIAKLNQSGTSAPVPTVFENTIGELTWTRTGVGTYDLTGIGDGSQFRDDNSTVTISGRQVDKNVKLNDTDYDYLQIKTYNGGGTISDNQLNNTTAIEIRSYN